MCQCHMWHMLRSTEHSVKSAVKRRPDTLTRYGPFSAVIIWFRFGCPYYFAPAALRFDSTSVENLYQRYSHQFNRQSVKEWYEYGLASGLQSARLWSPWTVQVNPVLFCDRFSLKPDFRRLSISVKVSEHNSLECLWNITLSILLYYNQCDSYLCCDTIHLWRCQYRLMGKRYF